MLAELFLPKFIDLLFDQLTSTELLKFARRYVGLEEKLKKWRETLKTIKVFLDDLDDADDEKVKTGVMEQWLDKLTDLAYDADDILDEFDTEASMRENQDSTIKVRKLILACCFPLTPRTNIGLGPETNMVKEKDENQASTSKGHKLIPACCRSSSRAINACISLGPKIDAITNRFDDILNEKNRLPLIEKVSRMMKVTQSTSKLTVAFGREADKKAIIELLLNETYNNGHEVSVISIHGMGGVGKTTLAQLVFNDEKVQSRFDVKAWVHVSEDFNVEMLTRRIYSSVIRASKDREMREFNQDFELETLQEELQKELCGKNFLIILDDVWNRDYQKWHELRSHFPEGNPKSRILITTRDRKVSFMMKGAASKVPAHHLKVLREEDCMKVFTLHALGKGNSFNNIEDPNLKDIGTKIAEKCKGLPLAALTFGGILRPTLTRSMWEEVSNRRTLDEPGVRNGIVQALMRSYNNLNPDIKRCFAYCSILPKNYEFEKKQLILLWMAVGLIRSQGEDQMEDLGDKYFQELVEKSFFEKSSNEPRFRMHDYINDVALWVARGMCFTMDDSFEGSNEQKNCKKARHLSYLCRHGNCRNNFEGIAELTHLRTFLPLVLPNQGTCSVSLQNLSKLGRLRALSLSGYHIIELPESIGDLMHLRYLDLSDTIIKSIPDTTTALCKLQTLILKNCHALKKLPSMFWKLVNLRHLNIQKTSSLEGMPTQMGKLTCLQTLSDFVVGKDHCSWLKELGPLSKLQETLCISRLENVIQPRDATDAKLIQKAKLDGLLLAWSDDLDDTQDKTIDTEVLNKLQPHKDLKELTIRNYDGTEFPMWLRTPSFPHMSLLRLENCKKCTTLPSVGQLSSLKVLSIIGMAGVQKVGREFYEGGGSDPFGSLETLCFKDMEEWDDWSPCKEFPRLRELSIQNCPKLSGKLPDHLPLLEKYEINDCPLLQDRPVTRVVQDIPRAESST